MKAFRVVLGIYFLTTIWCSMDAQTFVNYDHVYVESIRSVQLVVPGLQTTYPIINLTSGRMVLEFDEIGAQTRYLRYKIMHCNRDWTLSELTEFEYLEGFNGEELRQSKFSINTRTPYVHYEQVFPNNDVRWTKSGNYLLHIYDEDSNEPLITRRFVVVEPITKISIVLNRPSDVSKIKTHHEVDFKVNHKDLRIVNPMQEIHALVMQNGRWDNAIRDVIPFFSRPDELSFDYQDKIVFSAGREFRSVDFRSLTAPSVNVDGIESYEDAFEIKLNKDEKRTYDHYHFRKDLNGSYIIQSYDDNDPDIQADYAYVIFSLTSAQPLHDHDVYVVGGFNDWSIKQEQQLNYEERYGIYRGEALLKQGVYDYQYVAVNRESGEVDFDLLEGNWHEAENYYTVLVYYRPFGARYDRIIGVATFSEK